MAVAARSAPRPLPHSCRALASCQPLPDGAGLLDVLRSIPPAQLPLFNQIRGKVNLRDSCPLQPPPFAPPLCPATRTAHAQLRALAAPDAVSRIFCCEQGRAAAAGVSQDFPFPFSLFFKFFFKFYFTSSLVPICSSDTHKLLSAPHCPSGSSCPWEL